MKTKKQLQNEKGMALVVILAVVVLMSLIGTTILFSSNTGRKISTSYKGSADALQNADAGIAEAARKLFNKEIVGPVVPCGDTSSAALNWKYDGYTQNIANEYTVSYVFRENNVGVKSLACDETGNPLYQIIAKGYVTPAGGSAFDGNGKLDKTRGLFASGSTATSSGDAGVEKKLLAMVQVTPGTPGTDPVTTTKTEIDPAFVGAGIISGGDLRINGSSNIDGGTHTNGDTRFNGSGTVTGTVRAHGSITTNGSWTTGTKTSSADVVTVPQVTPERLAELRTIAQDPAKGIYNNGNFNYNGSGDLGKKVIFADGNLTLNGSIINGTIVATGNVTINGSSQINGNGEIGTAIVAQENITMNGSSDSHGVFWSKGSFVQNGASRVIGAIVSQGDITRNGSFNFTADGNIKNDNLPKVTTTVITPGTSGTSAISKYKVLSLKEV